MTNSGARQCESESGNPAAIARVRHALVLFGGIVPRKATTLLRER
jgi:inorganic triphosphatase YgiF